MPTCMLGSRYVALLHRFLDGATNRFLPGKAGHGAYSISLFGLIASIWLSACRAEPTPATEIKSFHKLPQLLRNHPFCIPRSPGRHASHVKAQNLMELA